MAFGRIETISRDNGQGKCLRILCREATIRQLQVSGSQKSSTFVNFSGRPLKGHSALAALGKTTMGHEALIRVQETGPLSFSLYLRGNTTIVKISESQSSSTFVTLTPRQAGRSSLRAASP